MQQLRWERCNPEYCLQVFMQRQQPLSVRGDSLDVALKTKPSKKISLKQGQWRRQEYECEIKQMKWKRHVKVQRWVHLQNWKKKLKSVLRQLPFKRSSWSCDSSLHVISVEEQLGCSTVNQQLSQPVEEGCPLVLHGLLIDISCSPCSFLLSVSRWNTWFSVHNLSWMIHHEFDPLHAASHCRIVY